jgi:hypothetical protein
MNDYDRGLKPTILTGTMSGSSAAAADTQPPQLVSGPGDTVAADANLVLTFNEAIQLGSGTLTLVDNDTLQAVLSVDLHSPAITVSGSTLTFDPPQPLAYVGSYTVQISAGGIQDLAELAARATTRSMPSWPTRAISPWGVTVRSTAGLAMTCCSPGAATIKSMAEAVTTASISSFRPTPTS